MVRLKDIAEITGFSITTVSRILNNDKTLRTSQNTKNIIKTVAEATGYKTLNEKKKERYKKKNSLSMVVGIIEMSSTNEVIKDPYYIYLKEFLEKVCRKNTIKSLSLTFDLKRQKYVNNDISKLKVNGLIAIGRFSKLEVKAMEKLSKNIVFLDTVYPNGEYSSIAPDLELGVKNGLDYLFEKGHSKIYFIGPTYAPNFFTNLALEVRRESFIKYMKEKKMYSDSLLLECERSSESAEQVLREYLLKGGSLPTAIFTVNESVAIGVVKVLREFGLNIPKDVSILSYNNTIYSSLVSPALSSVDINCDYMAQLAIDLVVKQNKIKNFSPIKILCSSIISEKNSIKALKG